MLRGEDGQAGGFFCDVEDEARVESDGGPGWGEHKAGGQAGSGADRVSLGSGAQGKVSECRNLIPAFSKDANVIPPSCFSVSPSILALGLLISSNPTWKRQ